MDNVDSALSDYSKALELEPNNSTAYHNRAMLFERKGK
jgi:Flp pilus assembly protein TadD